MMSSLDRPVRDNGEAMLQFFGGYFTKIGFLTGGVGGRSCVVDGWGRPRCSVGDGARH